MLLFSRPCFLDRERSPEAAGAVVGIRAVVVGEDSVVAVITEEGAAQYTVGG